MLLPRLRTLEAMVGCREATVDQHIIDGARRPTPHGLFEIGWMGTIPTQHNVCEGQPEIDGHLHKDIRGMFVSLQHLIPFPRLDNVIWIGPESVNDGGP